MLGVPCVPSMIFGTSDGYQRPVLVSRLAVATPLISHTSSAMRSDCAGFDRSKKGSRLFHFFFWSFFFLAIPFSLHWESARVFGDSLGCVWEAQSMELILFWNTLASIDQNTELWLVRRRKIGLHFPSCLIAQSLQPCARGLDSKNEYTGMGKV